MNKEVKVVFFDLFFTLITPRYNDIKNEFDVINLTKDEWESYAEAEDLYLLRATGKETNPVKIIEAILKKMKKNIDEIDKMEILKLREERFRKSLLEVDNLILEVLSEIKRKGMKLCLISNVDVIDVKYWEESPLKDLFDEVIFSYKVGYLKPQEEIYMLAIDKVKTNAEECVFVGDGGSDELKGAKEAGMRTILASHLLKREDDKLRAFQAYADYFIDDFNELREILFL